MMFDEWLYHICRGNVYGIPPEAKPHFKELVKLCNVEKEDEGIKCPSCRSPTIIDFNINDDPYYLCMRCNTRWRK